MSFVPRTHENGGICCSSPGNLCDTCKRHFGTMRSNAQVSYAPPNSYDAALQARALEALDTDQARAVAAELRRHDQGFMRVISLDATGGTYESYDGNGKTTVKRFKRDGSGIATPEYAPAQNAVTAAEAAELEGTLEFLLQRAIPEGSTLLLLSDLELHDAGWGTARLSTLEGGETHRRTLVFRRTGDQTELVSITGWHAPVPPPPEPFARGLAEMRAAAATPESTFEARWQAERLRELEVEWESGR